VIETTAGRPRFASDKSFQLESEEAYNPWVRAIGVGVVGTALYATHRTMLATVPEYAPTLQNWAQKFENQTPFHIGRTFAFTERLSSYTTPEELKFTRSMLTNLDGSLNIVGETFQRQFKAAGVDFDVLQHVTEDNPLLFKGRRRAGSAYMKLVGRDGIDFETRFTPSEGRLAGTASRLGQDLHQPPLHWSTNPNFRERMWENFQSYRSSQRITNASPWREAGKDASDPKFRPFHSRAHVEGNLGEEVAQTVRNVWSRFQVESLEAVERPQRLFAEAGFGLKAGTWNKTFHLPFAGEGGIVNQMITKRVLPIALAATAAGFLDYKLGHPSDKVIDLGLKANVLRADLTDMLPGGRKVTEFYENTVPGPQYGPLALPAAGAFTGGLLHYSRVVRGQFATEDLRKAGSRLLPDVKALRTWAGTSGKKLASVEGLAQIWKGLGTPGRGAAIGLVAALPFLPGMLGSRKTGNELRDVYSGLDEVPIRSGRWWELGSTPFEGARIKAWRPHWSVLHKSRAEDISLFGSEEEKWKHNPILHPIRWLKDPYYLEKLQYEDRPYPVASPAFTNVPLIGPLLGATIGKLVKPTIRMHEEDWDGKEYTLYSTRIEPKGPEALPPPLPKDEFSIGNALKKEATIFAEYTGLYGFIAKSGYQGLFPNTNSLGKEVDYQGSRQIDNFSRRYYEKELGAGIGPSLSGTEHFGYTEPFRRFVQRESFSPQANEIPNTAASWLPGDDYYTNFHVGDPFIKVDQGFARLPGAGYAALHPDLKDVDPEDYPDIHKMAILADVAPYSREYHNVRQRVAQQAKGDTELEIEYEKIMNRVKQTRESIIRMNDRHFTSPVDEISGTVDEVSPGGVTLKEFPGRRFQFSSVGMSAADLSAKILGENNDMTRTEVALEVDRRRDAMQQYLADHLAEGTSIRAVVPKGATDSAESIRAVILANGENVNRDLIDQGFGRYREDLGGAEARSMHGKLGRAIGGMAEGLAFQGDSSALNPMRYVPSPAHTKFWQERTPLAQYINNEVAGTRMRRWERPIHDFVMPYARGLVERVIGQTVLPGDVQKRRDLNTLADVMTYLRDLDGRASGSYTNKGQRTSIGANLFAAPTFVASTLPARESHYFREFLAETDPSKRSHILKVASPEMQRALSAQWAVQKSRIAEAEGKDHEEIGEGGRLYDEADVEEFEKADTGLDYGNWLRSKEIADFFSRTGFALPEHGSEAFDEALDYQDVELKIIQQEGYDAHDFNIFDDRASLLWRKPYIDGAVRELTSGDDRSPDQLRHAVEQIMLAANDKKADVRTSVHAGHVNHTNVRVSADIDQTEDLLRDIRRNPEDYQ
jgi:hypothetical protein